MTRKFLQVMTLGLFVIAIPSLALAANAVMPDCGCPFCAGK